jgi:hypothetical protein
MDMPSRFLSAPRVRFRLRAASNRDGCMVAVRLQAILANAGEERNAPEAENPRDFSALGAAAAT